MTGGSPGTRRKRPGVPCKIRLSLLLRWETPAGHRPAPGSHAAGAVPGPPSTRDTWQHLGTFPMSQPVGNTTGLWRAEARGAATCPAARATQCQEPALKAQPCRVTPLVKSQKSQSSKAEQIGSGGNGGGARAARPRGGTGLRALRVRAGRCGQLAIRPSRWDVQASSLHWRPGDSGARSSLSAP